MKKVGITESGTIIAELSLDEWMKAIALGRVAYRDTEDLYAWSETFRSSLRVLQLPPRVLHVFTRAAHVWTKTWIWNRAEKEKDWVECDPFIDSRWAFTIRNRLLDFDHWIDAILSGKIPEDDLLALRNLGPKSLKIFMAAIKEYKNAPVD